MNTKILQRYEQTFILLLNCLSVGCFILFIQLLLIPVTLIAVTICFLITITSVVLISRSYFFEKHKEVFDLTAPIIFETGLLVFQSTENRCAVFFSFNLTSFKYEKKLAQRTFTILLKILPSSAVLSLEWIRQNECFMNFYIKLEKPSFLTQSRELMENISGKLKNILGSDDVHLLSGEELTNHFYMGTRGTIQKITVNTHFSIGLKTDRASENKSLMLIKPVDHSTINHILMRSENIRQARIILPIRKDEKNFHISDSLIVISDRTEGCFTLETPLESFSKVDIPAVSTLRKFGDILSRNHFLDNYTFARHHEAVRLILNLISSDSSNQLDKEPNFLSSERAPQQNISRVTWRELLKSTASRLELPFKSETIKTIEDFPIRFDFQIGSLLFFIISQTKEPQMNWLAKKINQLLGDESEIEVVILTKNPQEAEKIRKIISSQSNNSRARLISTKNELESLLENYKCLDHYRKEKISQVA
ncbi:MAG: hypothetical protein ACFFD8_00075 [Candidatus Thorarchaeota archaeon]